MTDSAKDFLAEIAQHPSCQTGLKLDLTKQENNHLTLVYQELVQLGYLCETGKAIGAKYFTITDAGLAAAKAL